MDLTTRAYSNGTLDLPILSRGYGTLVDQATALDQVFLLIYLEKLGNLKSYLDYIHLPGLSSLPFLVVLMSNIAPKLKLGKLDRMGSFR